jgi:ABC-type lipoprotein export system ATPase subunit
MDGTMAKAGAGSEQTLEEPAQPLIALRGVSRLYDGGAIAAVRNIDLEIEIGDCVAIVGASGSGKSSLLNLLCGIDYPTSGTVSWEGRTVQTQRHWARLRRNSIGIVFQEYHLIPTLTALENVELALLGRGLSVGRPAVRAAAALDRVGLKGRRSPSCPVANVNGWRSPAPLSMNRSSCSPMSRRGISTAPT